MATKKRTVSLDNGNPPLNLDEHPFYGIPLDEEQRIFANAIWNPNIDIVFCNSKAGTGKAQPLDTVIPTPSGNKQLGDIRVGDMVFDANGNPTRVLGVFNQGKQRAYKVTFNDGRSTICAGEHLWTYYGYGNKLVTETLNSMMKRSIVTGDRGARYNIPSCKAVQYETAVQYIDPYVMGAFLGDGSCSSKYLTLSSSDEELVSEVARLLDCSYKRSSDKNYSWSFYENGKRIKTEDIFGRYPAVMTTCDKKRIPSEYIYSDVEQRYRLLQGLFDTDGCITYAESRYSVRYDSINRDLLSDVLKIIYSLGFSGTITEDKRDKYTHGVCYGLHMRIPNYVKPLLFRLTRKKNIASIARLSDKRRKYDRLAIRAIEDLGYECDMVCIYVDNKEHLYLTNDYIVTHNTTIAVGVADMLVKYGLFDGIVYIMSPYGERKQGWLPGSITEKSAVYFEALYQALMNCDINPNAVINEESLTSMKNGTGYITCVTDTFLRGSNLDNAVIIIDEAQNYTVSQLKKTLTRVGKKVKVIVIGHELQCDLDNPSESGFVKYIEHFKDCERAAICTLSTNHRSWISSHADEVKE